MTALPAKVIATEKLSNQYQVIVQVSGKYRGSFNILAFGEIKLYSGSLKSFESGLKNPIGETRHHENVVPQPIKSSVVAAKDMLGLLGHFVL